MFIFIKSIFSGKGNGQSGGEPAIEYNGFVIQPTPNKVDGGWSTTAIISKTVDDETKTHNFIRADTTTSKDSAVELIVSKAKVMIDQAGDKIFSR